MKTLLASTFAVSFLGMAAICATASEQPVRPTATIYAGPASIRLPVSVLAQAPVRAELKPSLNAEEAAPRQPVRVVLASPYASR